MRAKKMGERGVNREREKDKRYVENRNEINEDEMTGDGRGVKIRKKVRQ